MKSGKIIVLSIVAILALSNCGSSPSKNPEDKDTIPETNTTTPIKIDNLTEATLSQIGEKMEYQALINVNFSDKDGLTTSIITIDGKVIDLIIPTGTKEIDKNITINNLSAGSIFDTTLSVTGIDGETGEEADIIKKTIQIKTSNTPAIVDTPDKIAPTISNATYSTETLTNGNILVTFTTSENVDAPTNYTKIDNGNGSFSYTNTYTSNFSGDVIFKDTVGNETSKQVNISNIDKTAPTITLNGDSNITVLVGNSYIELGATAHDNVDGNITAGIIIKGTVDTTKAGVYKITYTVTDEAGNKSNTLTRTVNVKEAETPPIIGTLTNQTLENTQTLNYTLPITQTDGDIATVAVLGLPTGFSYDDATRTITGSSTTAGTTEVTVEATDDDGSVSESFEITVGEANTAPTLNLELSVNNGANITEENRVIDGNTTTIDFNVGNSHSTTINYYGEIKDDKGLKTITIENPEHNDENETININGDKKYNLDIDLSIGGTTGDTNTHKIIVEDIDGVIITYIYNNKNF